ncbi:MAG: lysine--tRNA ligase [Planctomycetota bacterium]|nr:lysine--tRNA ligase [Planctomycetota bacterium]
MSDELHKLESQRRSNRDAATGLAQHPYGRRTDGILSTIAAKSLFSKEANDDFNASSKQPGYTDPRPQATVAGRIMLSRDNGKLIWFQLRDADGDLQVAVSQRDCAAPGFDLAKLTDLGDVIIASGRVMMTKTGETTLWANSVAPAAKCLVPPPEKHSGLQDVELRYRQRYVDMWANPETLSVLKLRSRIVSRIREFLSSRDYLEVETPMLQTLAGGAAARPFVTHMNALDISLFMRIAPELYLKRLLVGGMRRVFEINRNFRNEGLDKQHNPEFTMLEAYHAYGDVQTVMELTESAIRDAATLVRDLTQPGTAGDVILPFGDLSINYSRPFSRVTYGELFAKAYGFDMSDIPKARATLKGMRPNLAAAIDAMDGILVINELFEEKGEAQLDHSVPTFITDYPAAISPLTRPKTDNPVLADRADLFIAGMEIAPHYTELNDPDVQESKFREQLKGLDAEKSAEENTFRTFDHDFIRALKVGMPPAGGMGLGIDRLVMLLTNQRTIRDVVLFPMMRPEE